MVRFRTRRRLTSRLLEGSAVRRQSARFQALLADTRVNLPHQKQMLVFLQQREDSWVSVREIARLLGYSPITLTKKPPAWLITNGLLKSSGMGAQRTLKSSVREILERDYPALDTDVLISQLLSACK
jgi:hypothetical protein